MKIRNPWRLAWLAPLVALAACADHPRPADPAEKVSAQLRSGSSELRAYQIEDWIAPDDRTLIVNGLDRSLLQARFKHRCPGLRLADTIAFVVHSPPQLEKYTGIVLPDGTRCAFASFSRLETSSPPSGQTGTRN